MQPLPPHAIFIFHSIQLLSSTRIAHTHPCCPLLCSHPWVNVGWLQTSHWKLLEAECAVLERIKHEHIIQLFMVIDAPKYLYLVIEWCRYGDLDTKVCVCVGGSRVCVV